ncbi:MAG: sulfite exporter TauE/SafE family protein [Planctomycetota bacterium]
MNAALLGAILAASFLGSLHCLGMCGPLVAAGVAPLGASRREAILAHGLYHLGRLSTLALLGLLAGLLGAGLEGAGQLLGLQRVAAVVSGLLLVLWGAGSLARQLGAERLHLRLPFGARVGAALRRVNALPDRRRALLLGALTPLLPCGWLWLFALTAAGTGHALAGAAVLVTFGLGNTPALLGLGLGARGLLARLGGRLQLASAALLIVVGGLLIFGRSQALAALPRGRVAAAATATSASASGAEHTAPQLAPVVPVASESRHLPCCGGKRK